MSIWREQRRLGGVRWLLEKENTGLSCVAKYLLARVWLQFGTFPVEEKISASQEVFGISRRAFIKARNELLADSGRDGSSSYLVNRSQDERSDWRGGSFTPGRPVRAFRIERAFGEKLAAASLRGAGSNDHNITAALLYRTFSLSKNADRPEESVKEEGSRALPFRLAVPGRLLLAILWSLADRRGVVADAGHRRLSQLAGVSLGQVRNQLARLEQLGLLTLRVPGLTGRFVPGKVPSALVLNRTAIGCSGAASDAPLREWILDLGKLRSVAFVHQTSDQIWKKRNMTSPLGRISGRESDRWIEAEASGYPSLAGGKQKEPEKEAFPPLYSAFVAEPRRAEVREYLLFKACEYVTWLVNDQPAQVLKKRKSKKNKSGIHGLLLKRVEKDLLSNGRLKERFGEGRTVLARWFCLHIWQRAQEVIGIMAKQESVSPESVVKNIGSNYLDILLIPVPGKTVNSLTYRLREQPAEEEKSI
ncbi:hypothetical protein [Alloalcanivorax xenomutans]|uniref:Uncharacterized protein n=1 Tax=Alloalcanivorax xenomutans TaxID=1094342 RepID=A0A9Q3ZEH5_9GAMM|nr:hypothetical protein [Alloalcanivorax xenomutans]MCE7510705.1 hypothetical protein [Alloalcanivorax xenomutans]